MSPYLLPPPDPAAPTPGRRLAAYRRIALTVPASGDPASVIAGIVARLPERCPWILVAAGRRLTSDDRLVRVGPDQTGLFPDALPLDDPIAGWAIRRGDALIVLDCAAVRIPGAPAAGALVAAPIVRLDGAAIGTLEVVARQPFGVLDGDGQGLRQLGQAIARLAAPDAPVHRPAAVSRQAVRPRIAAFVAAAAAFQSALPPVDRPAGSAGGIAPEVLLRVAGREAQAAHALTSSLIGGYAAAPANLDAAAPAQMAPWAGLDGPDAVALYRLVHREIRRILAQLTDPDLERDPRIADWIDALTAGLEHDRDARAGGG